MPKITSTASDKQVDAMTTTTNMIPSIASSHQAPFIITAVQRKANTGNFETIDIYCAIGLPVTQELDFSDQEALDHALVAAVDFGMEIASRETGARYKVIKDRLKG